LRAIAGVAGALNGLLLQIAAPDQFSLHVMVQVLMIVIIGGPGTLLGPIVGAFIVRLSGPLMDQLDRQPWTNELPKHLEEALTSHGLILGVLYILLILFVPGGVISFFIRERKKKASEPGQAQRPAAEVGAR